MVKEIDVNELFALATYYNSIYSMDINLLSPNHIRVTLLDEEGTGFEANVFQGEIFEILIQKYEMHIFETSNL